MNYDWDWGAVGDSWPLLWDGFKTTLLATVLGTVVATVLGLLVAMAGRAPTRLVSVPVRVLTEFVRSTPLLVQLVGAYAVFHTVEPLTIGIVAFQVVLAIALRNQPWWLVIGVAWLVGAWATHTLWVLIHEATHNLMVESKVMNRALGVIANLPMLVPSAESFRIYHLKHHKFQGDYELDADLPRVGRALHPPYQPGRLHPLGGPGRGRHLDVQYLRQPRHRERAVVQELREHQLLTGVQLGPGQLLGHRLPCGPVREPQRDQYVGLVGGRVRRPVLAHV